MPKKRLRIFAGPNGSGKSTIFEHVNKTIGCPFFVNADNIKASLSRKGTLNFNDYAIELDLESFLCQLKESSWAEHIVHIDELVQSAKVQKNSLSVPGELVDGYFAAFVADFIRNSMLNVVQTFTIETVLSDKRKLDYIKRAKSLGYRIYLYFVSTKDAEINVRRVAQRVSLGGHSVPDDKIRNRYARAHNNLYDTLLLCDRAFIFDNSEENWLLLAELDQGNLILHSDTIPLWLHDSVFAHLTE